MSIGPIRSVKRVLRWPRASALVDVGLAISVGVVFVITRFAADPVRDVRAADGLSAALALAAAAPIAWRRLRPTTALATTMLCNAVAISVGEPEIGLALVGYFLAFSATVFRPNPTLRPVVTVAAGGLAIQVIAALVERSGGEAASMAATDSIALLIAVLIGDNVLRRRQRVVDLEERAALLLREQELAATAAVSVERTRIARELHDVVAHSVSIIALQAAAGQRVVHRSPKEGFDALSTIERTARSAMTELRTLLDVLRDDTQDGSIDPPQPTLEQLDRLMTADPGLRVRFVEVGARPDVGVHAALTVYRIVQEGLTNVRKHAPGAAATVTIEYAQQHIDIDIHNGPSPQPHSPIANGGHGLIGIRERVSLAGGVLRFGQCGDTGGWALHCRLPIERAVEKAP